MTDLGLYERIRAAAQAVSARCAIAPQVGLILGSGLGGYADALGRATAIDYGDIPYFPRSHVVGHKGRLVIGERAGARCVAMQGRVHLYEGHSAATVAFPVRVLIALGAKVIIVTNAAGGVNPAWPAGTLMVIRDHLDLLRDHALRGPNDDRLGPHRQRAAVARRGHRDRGAGARDVRGAARRRAACAGRAR